MPFRDDAVSLEARREARSEAASSHGESGRLDSRSFSLDKETLTVHKYDTSSKTTESHPLHRKSPP